MAKTATTEKRKRGRPKKETNGSEEKETKRAAPAGVDRFGFRIGSKKSAAAAMYSAKGGATLGEVKEALKSTQFNLLNELEERKIKIEKVKVPGPGARQVTRYHIIGAPK